jgi:hypothetical protein
VIAAGVLAGLCNDLYAGADGFVQVWTQDDVVVGLARVDGADVLVLRGSMTAEDWLRDFEAVPEWHPQLGYCHSGFLRGMDDVFASARAIVGPAVAITGHSLGGARARILAGLFAVNGLPVAQLCTFGAPKPAFVNLARIIQKSGMVHSSYRNRRDVVPTVPLTVWPFFEFVHSEDWTACDAAPEATNLEPLRDHSCALYVKALTTLPH